MCRLYFKGDISGMSVNQLEDNFSYLESKNGGNGNGIAFPKTGEIIKGVHTRPRALAEAAREVGGPVLFHTRAASIGDVVDELCQPFGISISPPKCPRCGERFVRKHGRLAHENAGCDYSEPDPGFLLAHNGHWPTWKNTVSILLEGKHLRYLPVHMNDSLTGAFLCRAWGPMALVHYIGQGVWLHSTVGPNPVVKVMLGDSGEFWYNTELKEAASEPVFWKNSQLQVTPDAFSVIQLWPTVKTIKGGLYKDSGSRRKGKVVWERYIPPIEQRTTT